MIRFAKLLGVPNGISMKYAAKVLLFFNTCNILYEKSANLSNFALFSSICHTLALFTPSYSGRRTNPDIGIYDNANFISRHGFAHIFVDAQSHILGGSPHPSSHISRSSLATEQMN